MRRASLLLLLLAGTVLGGCTGPRRGEDAATGGGERTVAAALERVLEDLDRASLAMPWAVLRIERGAAADGAATAEVRMLTPDDRTVVATVAAAGEGRWRVRVDAGYQAEAEAARYLDEFVRLLRGPRARQYQGHFEYPPRAP